MGKISFPMRFCMKNCKFSQNCKFLRKFPPGNPVYTTAFHKERTYLNENKCKDLGAKHSASEFLSILCKSQKSNFGLHLVSPLWLQPINQNSDRDIRDN